MHKLRRLGVDLGSLGSINTKTLKHKGKTVYQGEMKPGDLVFLDTYKIDGPKLVRVWQLQI